MENMNNDTILDTTLPIIEEPQFDAEGNLIVVAPEAETLVQTDEDTSGTPFDVSNTVH